MFSAKIVVAGREESGKSAVVNRLVHQPFQPQNDSDAPPQVRFQKENGIDYTVVDCASDPRYRGMDGIYLQEARFLIYCVDISKEFDETAIEIEIEDEVQALNAKLSHCPDAQVILVGTKKDNLCRSGEAFFERLQTKLPDYPCFLTSAKKDIEFKALNDHLNKTVLEQSMQDLITRYDASEKILQEALISLPVTKKQAINNKLGQLKNSLSTKLKQHDASLADTEKEIQQFVTDCEAIIEEKHQDVLKAIHTAVVVLGTACAISLIGYALGFAAGVWSGPGAFFSAFVAGTGAAITVLGAGAFVGGLMGGIAAFSLFKPSGEAMAVSCFAEKIREKPEDPLQIILGQ